MPRALILVLLRMLVLVALAVSSALLYDYRGGVGTFCTEAGTGCGKIKESAFASIFGVSTPLIGVIAFVVLFGVTLLPHEHRKKLMPPVAVLGALSAAAFIAIQAFIEHAFCKLCMIIDSSAILAGALSIWYWLKRNEGEDDAISSTGWAVLGALAIAAPQAFGRIQPAPEVKPAVLKHWAPGKINIIEMSDFECPFCRLQHPEMMEAVKGFEDRVHFVRLTVPLASHVMARPASRAYLCAKDQGKGEAMAHELFTEELTPGTIEKDAEKLTSAGLNLEQFHRCVADPATDARVTEDYREAHDVIGFKGLPTTWVGSQLLEGAHSAKDLRAAIEREASPSRTFRPDISPVWLWSALVALLLGAGGWSLRKVLRKPA